jgi:diadenosine tetraphosphatase ApaH/serine/threonine PP2A family protein phosphatase
MMLTTERDRFIRQDVRDAIRWTRETLPADARQHVATLPMSLRYAGIEVIHASHVFKPDWHYVIDNHSVMANFLFQHASVAFNGHTHLPLAALHQRGSQPRLLMLRSMKLPPRHKFMINVGSVGQPRDRNPEASFVLYETKDRSVEIHRIPYDIEETQKQMREARLPLNLITRLSEGR